MQCRSMADIGTVPVCYNNISCIGAVVLLNFYMKHIYIIKCDDIIQPWKTIIFMITHACYSSVLMYTVGKNEVEQNYYD